MAAALTISPRRGHLGLYFQSYPNQYVDASRYSDFLRRVLLWHMPHPLVVVQDQGTMHKGPLLRELAADFPRLDLNMLPAYAPELNPTEQLWNHAKYQQLSNFAAMSVTDLNEAVCDCLEAAKADQRRLRSFFAATPLPWDGVTIFI